MRHKSAKRGRPELPDEERRSLVAQFRCTPSERKLMEEAAEANGKRLSDWLRDQAIISANGRDRDD